MIWQLLRLYDEKLIFIIEKIYKSITNTCIAILDNQNALTSTIVTELISIWKFGSILLLILIFQLFRLFLAKKKCKVLMSVDHL